jgi:hypothetical protein
MEKACIRDFSDQKNRESRMLMVLARVAEERNHGTEAIQV